MPSDIGALTATWRVSLSQCIGYLATSPGLMDASAVFIGLFAGRLIPGVPLVSNLHGTKLYQESHGVGSMFKSS